MAEDDFYDNLSSCIKTEESLIDRQTAICEAGGKKYNPCRVEAIAFACPEYADEVAERLSHWAVTLTGNGKINIYNIICSRCL